ncbi:MAG: hypothetical protein AAFV53_01250 [Myxococcota bacterium]
MLWLLPLLLGSPAFAEEPDETTQTSWKNVRPLRRVQPRVPEEAYDLGLAEVTCSATFKIDEQGVPYDIQLDRDCPSVFHQTIREAGYGWRFEPYLNAEGEPVKASFILKLTFRFEGAGSTDSDVFLFSFGGAVDLPVSVGNASADWSGEGQLLFQYVEDHLGLVLGLSYGHINDPDGVGRIQQPLVVVGAGYMPIVGEHGYAGIDLRLGVGPGFWRDEGDDLSVGLGGNASLGIPLSVWGQGSFGVQLRPALITSRYVFSGGARAPVQLSVALTVLYRN